jgi:hypothetical protein
VKAVDQVASLLVSGHSNIKIGRDVRKARFRGYWIYTLSLEERKDVPRLVPALADVLREQHAVRKAARPYRPKIPADARRRNCPVIIG